MEKGILKILQLGVVYGDNGFQVTLDRFLDKLEKNIKKNGYSVIYNEKDLNFDIIYGGKVYTLLLDSKTQKELVQSKYNDTTFRLKKLADHEFKVRNTKVLRNDSEAIAKIIEDGDNDILPNHEAKEIYLNELIRRRKNAFGKIFDSGGDWSFAGGGISFFLGGIICAFVGTVIPVTLIMFLLGVTFSTALGSVVATIISAHNKGETLSKLFNYRRVLKHQIEELRESLEYGKSNSIADVVFDRTLVEPVESFPYQFKDTIFQELSDLLDKIKYINNLDDKNRLNDKVRILLEKYKKGILEIDGADAIESFSGKNIAELTRNIRSEIDRIEWELIEIRAKEISNDEFQKEYSVLDERLGPIELDATELKAVIDQKEPVPVYAKTIL